MSWDSYVATLTKHKMIEDAAIWGKNTGNVAPWAASPGLNNMTAAEIQKLAGEADIMRQNGPHVGGMKCMLIGDNRADPNLFSMNLKSTKDEKGNTYPVCVGESLQALVIAKGTATANAGTVADAVYKIVKHLRDAKY